MTNVTHTYSHRQTTNSSNGTLYAPRYEEAFLPIGKRRPRSLRSLGLTSLKTGVFYSPPPVFGCSWRSVGYQNMCDIRVAIACYWLRPEQKIYRYGHSPLDCMRHLQVTKFAAICLKQLEPTFLRSGSGAVVLFFRGT